MNEQAFWMVLGRGVPTYRHQTPEGARKEAERLARMNPGEKFYVLAAIGMANYQCVNWIPLCDGAENIGVEHDQDRWQGNPPF